MVEIRIDIINLLPLLPSQQSLQLLAGCNFANFGERALYVSPKRRCQPTILRGVKTLKLQYKNSFCFMKQLNGWASSVGIVTLLRPRRSGVRILAEATYFHLV